MHTTGFRLERRPWERRGVSRSTHYAEVAAGLMTRPVHPAARVAAWPAHEIDAVIAANIAGASVDSLRGLVAKLHAERAALADGDGSPKAA